MKKDYLTIVVQPEWKSTGRTVSRTATFEVPVRIFYYLAVMIPLLVWFGVNGIETVSRNLAYRQKARLLENYLAQLQSVDARVENMRKETRIIRAFLGLDDAGSDIDSPDRLGQGGLSPASGDIHPAEIDARQEFAEFIDRQPLHTRVAELRDDLQEMTAKLAKKNKLLSSMPTIMPVKDHNLWITSSFGWRRSPFTGMREFHNGLDISSKRGAPVIATADGTVTDSGKDPYLGNFVTLKHDSRFSTTYGHMLGYSVKQGQKVLRGQQIGSVGSTGLSTGYHVHYIVTDRGKDVNPYNYILNRAEIAFAPDLNFAGSAED